MNGRNANRTLASRFHSESGATLIQVAVMIVVLSGFSALVLDQGVMWLARVQAQNAADAGALAGALARAYDETTPPVAGGLAETSALTAARGNAVGPSGGVTHVSVDFKNGTACPPFVLGTPGIVSPRCARVDVFRDGSNGSTPLPTFFANVFGVTSQPVRASATAWVRTAGTASCLRPFAIADKWSEKGEVLPHNLLGEFNRWRTQGGSAVQIPTPDVYLPPSTTSTGTGYTTNADLGALVTIKVSSSTGPITPGWFLAVQVPDAVDANGVPTSYTNGAAEYRQAIKTCLSKPVSIGDYLPLETGNMVGPTASATKTDSDSLINQDPGAMWTPNDQTGRPTGGCVPSCGALSPRVVPIAVFDLDEYQWRVTENNWTNEWIPGVGPGGGNFICPGGKCVRVVNIVGVFVTDVVSGDVQGRLMIYPGQLNPSAPGVAIGASFLNTVQLIR